MCYVQSAQYKLSQYKPACTRGLWHLTTVRTCARPWPKAQRSGFVAFFSLYMQVSVFEQYSVIYLFLKLLYFLHSHCQLSPAISVEFRTWGVLLLCIISDETCLWVEVCEWKASGTERVSVLLRGYHSCKPSTCGMVSSYCHATLLYVLSITIHYFREMKLFMYLFICFIFICCCFVCPNLDYPFRCSAAEHLDLTCVFFMLLLQLNDSVARNMKMTERGKSETLKV